jgi:hypothetical protein
MTIEDDDGKREVVAVPGNLPNSDNSRTEPFTYTRYKIGDGVNFVTDLDFVIEHGISGTVTRGVGGIEKDKVYTNASINQVLTDLLFPYIAPTFTSISTSAASGEFECGASRTIRTVTPNFTKGSKEIISVKIGTTAQGYDLYLGTTATSGKEIELAKPKTYDGRTGGTIYCTLSDGTTTISASATISYVYHNYTTVTNNTSIPKSGARNIGTKKDATHTTTDNTYIWFLIPEKKDGATIQQFAMNQWNDVNTTYAGEVEFTINTGKDEPYHAYRTDKMLAATGTYRINY